MRECRAEGCPHIAADGCDYCKQHDEPDIAADLEAINEAARQIDTKIDVLAELMRRPRA